MSNRFMLSECGGPDLLTLFAKNERSNLSKAERNELTELVRLLVATWQEEQ